MGAWVPRVEFVGWDGRARDATSYVAALSWSCAVMAPWETISLQLRCSWAELQQVIPGADKGRKGAGGQALYDPRPGFYVVVRDPSGAALAWGRAARVSSRWINTPDGKTATNQVEIACESWLSVLSRSRITCVASSNYTLGSLVLTPQEWYNLLTRTVLSRAVQQTPGESLARWWREAAAFRLPDVLVGGLQRLMGESIPVVHDRTTAATFAPLRLPQTLRVPGSALQAFSNAAPRGSWWGWMEGTFVGAPSMCELFPSLEYPTAREDITDGPWRGLEDGGEGRLALSYTDLASSGGVRSVAGELTALGEALGGAQPVLVYRLRPGILEPLNTQSALGHPLAGESPDVPRAQEVAVGSGLPTSYGQEPIDPRPLVGVKWYDLEPSQVLGVDLLWDDGDRQNAVAVNLAGVGAAGVEMWGYLGQPVFGARAEVEQHGLRLQDVDWPICPPGVRVDDLSNDVERLQGQIGDRLTGLAEIAFALGGAVDRDFFPARATVQAALVPWAKAGHWLRVDAGQGRELTGYIDRVVHSARLDNDGKLSARSVFTLSRVALGLQAQASFPLRFSLVGDFVDVNAG